MTPSHPTHGFVPPQIPQTSSTLPEFGLPSHPRHIVFALGPKNTRLHLTATQSRRTEFHSGPRDLKTPQNAQQTRCHAEPSVSALSFAPIQHVCNALLIFGPPLRHTQAHRLCHSSTHISPLSALCALAHGRTLIAGTRMHTHIVYVRRCTCVRVRGYCWRIALCTRNKTNINQLNSTNISFNQ